MSKVNNRLQVAQCLLGQKERGITINTSFEAPSTGYMASLQGLCYKTSAPELQDVLEWVSRGYERVETLPNMYFGVWKDGDDYYFDYSYRFTSLDACLDFARKGNQLAIWDNEKQSEIRVSD
jgi:hypothetical protein